MTYIPTESVRERAFEAWQNSSSSLPLRERLDAVLVAVGPSIATDACDLGIRLGWNKALSGYSHEQIRAMNPYREQEAR